MPVWKRKRNLCFLNPHYITSGEKDHLVLGKKTWKTSEIFPMTIHSGVRVSFSFSLLQKTLTSNPHRWPQCKGWTIRYNFNVFLSSSSPFKISLQKLRPRWSVPASIGALKHEEAHFLHPINPSNMHICILPGKTQGLLQQAGSCSDLGSIDRVLV